MQRSRPVYVPGRRVGAVLDEEPCYVQMSVKGRVMQRSRPAYYVLGRRVGAVLDEEPCHVQISA